jgi:hypothetical protein
MYLILALLFCALLVVALGIVLFVSLTGDPGEQPAAEPQTQQQAAPAGSALPGVSPSLSGSGVRAPSVSSPSLSAPSVSGPAVSAPSISGSGISPGSVTAPSVSRPSLTTPSVSGPSVSSPSLPTVPRVSGGQLSSAANSAQTGQPAAAETGGTPYLALIIMLSVLLVIAVGAAVFFALRRA